MCEWTILVWNNALLWEGYSRDEFSQTLKRLLAGVTLELTTLHCPYMAIYGQWNCFMNLKTNFKDFEFVFGAKVIYFFQRIRIHRNFWRARTSARAARAENSGIWAKNHQKCHFRHFCSALSARASARAPNFFSDLNSPNPGDEFCTLNESKIVKIDN